MKKILALGLTVLLMVVTFLSSVNIAYALRNDQPSEYENDQNAVEVTNDVFDLLNPLKFTNSDQADALSTPGGILSRVLFFAFPIAGLILFVMIVYGGFEMLSGATSKKSMDSGRQRITAAVGGFFMLFVSYWIMQIIERVFGVTIF